MAGRSRHFLLRGAAPHTTHETHGTFHAQLDLGPGTLTAGFKTATAVHACSNDRLTDRIATFLYGLIALNCRSRNNGN